MRAINAFALAAGWVLASASPGLLADEIYKSVASDGSVTYSQAPIPGARNSTVEIQVLSPEERRASLMLRQQLATSNTALEDSFARREQAWRDADIEIRDATDKLVIEESTLESGREPRAEEWIQNKAGGTRMTQAYFDRLRFMEANVERARQRLDRAYAARDALK
jgi:Domain of unknown function (DUF4124)